jgi:hypothetical protein
MAFASVIIKIWWQDKPNLHFLEMCKRNEKFKPVALLNVPSVFPVKNIILLK